MPNTEAGKRLLDAAISAGLRNPAARGVVSASAIAAIEAEARNLPTTDATLAEVIRQVRKDERARLAEAVRGTMRLRLTGEQLDALPDGTNREDFFIDFDEWEEWVPLSILAALLEPTDA